MADSTAQVQLHTVAEACGIMRIGRTYFYQLVGNGEIAIIKLGNRTFVDYVDLCELIARKRHKRGDVTIRQRGLRFSADHPKALDWNHVELLDYPCPF